MPIRAAAPDRFWESLTALLVSGLVLGGLAFGLPHMRMRPRWQPRRAVPKGVVITLRETRSVEWRTPTRAMPRTLVLGGGGENGGVAPLSTPSDQAPPEGVDLAPLAPPEVRAGLMDVPWRPGGFQRLGGQGDGTTPGLGRGRKGTATLEGVGGDPRARILEAHEVRALVSWVPVYPAEAQASGLEGEVVVSFTVGLDGLPEGFTVESGPRIFHGKTLEALRDWRFEPMVHQGQPVRVRVKMTFQFRLPEALCRSRAE